VRQAIRWKDSLIRAIEYGVMAKAKIAEQPFSNLFRGATEIVRCTWVKVNGLLLKAGNCYLTVGCDSDDNPVYAKVVDILVWPELLLICQAVHTDGYDTHLSAYKIADLPGTWRVVRPTDLVVRRIYHAHDLISGKYIAMKECVKSLSF